MLVKILAFALFSAQPLSAQQSPASAIVDVSVIPMSVPGVREHQTVVVQGGVIRQVGDRASITPPSGATVIDGRGKYLIPGLVDAHVHLMDQADLPQFLAWGVTTVRNLMGSPDILAWRNAVAEGKLAGPRIITSGPLLAGASVPWKNKVVPTDADAAREAVRRQQQDGYDLIKIYDGLSADVYAAALAEAARLRLPVTGHIPQSVHLAGVLQARQNIEHTDKIVFDVWGHSFDTTRIADVARDVASARVFVTPTIAAMQKLAQISSGKFDSLLARPAVRRVSAPTLALWCEVTARLRGNRQPRAGVRYDPYTDFQMQVIAGERRAGVPLLAGTDYPNALLAPGSGLIEELQALTEAGLTNAEALAAATTTAARGLGDSVFGVVMGARADLVLLDANPLNDLRALEQNSGVMAAGRWYSRAELDRLVPARPTPPRC